MKEGQIFKLAPETLLREILPNAEEIKTLTQETGKSSQNPQREARLESQIKEQYQEML